MHEQDQCGQSAHYIDYQDPAMEAELFETLFLQHPTDQCPDLDTTMFDAQGMLGGVVDIEPLEKTWSPLDLSDLICADL